MERSPPTGHKGSCVVLIEFRYVHKLKECVTVWYAYTRTVVQFPELILVFSEGILPIKVPLTVNQKLPGIDLDTPV